MLANLLQRAARDLQVGHTELGSSENKLRAGGQALPHRLFKAVTGLTPRRGGGVS